jgi:poly(3-hydroxybutyrate) depolymerase
LTRRLFVVAGVLAALVCAASSPGAQSSVRTLTFSYRSNDGMTRTAYLVLPAWYGADRHPPIPLVISPHGRGVDGRYNLRFWGSLPARGPFALVSPDGQGRRLPLYSWGYPGQIADLARMPALVAAAFPWLAVDPDRVYAIGDSMGGQEVLLLMARPDVRLAGVVALDPVTDMAARYRRWFTTSGEARLPARARIEFGGTPAQAPHAYAARSPDAFLSDIAQSGTPLQLWWSHRDKVVTDQLEETGAFYRKLERRVPGAPVQEIVGYWQHAHEMHPGTQLPAALACFGLVPTAGVRVPAYVKLRGPGSAVEELPPERGRAAVALTRAFCGRAAQR